MSGNEESNRKAAVKIVSRFYRESLGDVDLTLLVESAIAAAREEGRAEERKRQETLIEAVKAADEIEDILEVPAFLGASGQWVCGEAIAKFREKLKAAILSLTPAPTQNKEKM